MEIKKQSQIQTVQKKSQSERVCSSCGNLNDLDALFCGECGNGFETAEKPCPVCGELNSGIYCEFCGANTEGYTCKQCNTIQYTDFCGECGEPLTEMAMNFIQVSAAPASMTEISEQEAFAIINDLMASLTPRMLKEQENKRQRIILLREREYFDEREKRIKEYYSAGTRKVRVINHEEMEAIKKSVERLRGYVVKEKERIDEEIRIQEEIERIEKERREREKYNNRISGVWISTSDWVEIMKVNNNGNMLTGNSHWKVYDRECVYSLSGSWNGSTFQIQSTHIRQVHGLSGHFRFFGTVNKSGNIINGYFIDESNSKQQQIFMKQ